MTQNIVERLRSRTPNMTEGHAAMEEAADTIAALRTEVEMLTAEVEKANNEFGSQTAVWPDLWRRIAQLKELSNERWQQLEAAEASAEAAEAELAAVRAAAKAFSHDHWGWGSGERQGRKTCDFCHGVGAYDDWTGPIQHDAGCKTAILRAALNMGDTDDRA